MDLGDCSIEGDGAAQLQALWRDPDFDADQRAFYYARVLEHPTCRWSTWDAIREGVPPRSGMAKTIQERAWSSPIQYRPAGPTSLALPVQARASTILASGGPRQDAEPGFKVFAILSEP